MAIKRTISISTGNPRALSSGARNGLGLILFLLSSQGVSAATLLLDCEVSADEDSAISESGEAIQIYINFDDSYVIYNAHFLSANELSRNQNSKNRTDTQSGKIEGELTINTNSEEAIEASNDSSSFLYLKQDRTFLYAWTSLIPSGNNTIQSFSATFSGSCLGPSSAEQG